MLLDQLRLKRPLSVSGYIDHSGNWDLAALEMVQACKRLERGGADLVALCTNTMHKVAPAIEAETRLPFFHIADAAGEVLVGKNTTRVGLLGTRFTMEEEFYRRRLEEKFNIEVLIPEENERDFIHGVIYDELCLGKFLESSRSAYLKIIDGLAREGAQGVILGCTEIGLLIHPSLTTIPLFDTARIHASKVANYSLSGFP